MTETEKALEAKAFLNLFDWMVRDAYNTGYNMKGMYNTLSYKINEYQKLCDLAIEKENKIVKVKE